MPGHRVTVPAQNLQQVEQALATGQGADSQLLQAVAGVVVEGDEDQQAIAVLRRRPPVGLLQFEFATARMTEALELVFDTHHLIAPPDLAELRRNLQAALQLPPHSGSPMRSTIAARKKPTIRGNASSRLVMQ